MFYYKSCMWYRDTNFVFTHNINAHSFRNKIKYRSLRGTYSYIVIWLSSAAGVATTKYHHYLVVVIIIIIMFAFKQKFCGFCVC